MSTFPSTPQQLLGIANVLDYGAKGDGSTDDTAAFNAALAANQNVVWPGYLRNGTLAQYVIAGQITIPRNGSLTGPNAGLTATPGNSFFGTDSGSSLNIAINPATIPGLLLITGNSGNASGTAAITINSNATLQNFCAYYPNQAQLLTSSSAPTAYPYFATMPAGVNATMRNGGVINPYQLLQINGMWRPTVCDIVAQPYSMGIWINNCYDCARIERVHFESFWDASQISAGYFYQPWTFANGTGFYIERCDLAQFVNVFAYGYKYGLVLASSDTTSANSPWATFTAAHFDNCVQPITVNKTQAYGANFSNCMITGGQGTSVTVASTNGGPLSFSNCLFVSNGTGISLAGSGDTSLVGCTFAPVSGTGSAAISHSGGGVLASGCNFLANTVQYANASGALWASLTGNRCKTSVSIPNAASVSAFSQSGNLAY